MPISKNSLWRVAAFFFLFQFYFSAAAQINCENDSTGKIPIVDLLSDFYNGRQGGLYPGGFNTMPAAHADSGIAIAGNLLPINFDGDIDTVYGKMVMLGLGSSSAGRSFNKMLSQYEDNGYGDSCFRIVNGCIDAYGLEDMISDDADDNYYKDVNDFLQAANLKKKQVRIIWLMAPDYSDSLITESAYIDTLTERYVSVMRRLKSEFINLELLYISGLQYGGYTDTLHVNAPFLAEPVPYLTDFAIKAAIERQIGGDSLLAYSGDDIEAAWTAWGPNFWADGKNLRAWDDLRWMCPSDYDTAEDGFFLSGSGQQKVGGRIFDFFAADATAAPWFFGLPYDCVTEVDTVAPDTVYYPDDEVIWIIQNPVKGVVKFLMNIESDDRADIYVFNMQGQQVVEGVFSKIEPGKTYSIKLIYNERGIYILSVGIEGRAYNVPFYLDN